LASGFRAGVDRSKAIQLHPLVCTAFNADFDGDPDGRSRAVIARSSAESARADDVDQQHPQPANGKPIIVPSQDIVLGLYYIHACARQ